MSRCSLARAMSDRRRRDEERANSSNRDAARWWLKQCDHCPPVFLLPPSPFRPGWPKKPSLTDLPTDWSCPMSMEPLGRLVSGSLKLEAQV